MKLRLASDEIQITPELEEVIQKKLLNKISRLLKRYPEDSVSMDLVIKAGSRWGFVVKCRLDIPGENIHAEEKHKELEYAIVALSEELQRLLRKKKEKEIN